MQIRIVTKRHFMRIPNTSGQTDSGVCRFRSFFNACTAALLVLFVFSFRAGAIDLNFSSVVGSQLDFSGGTFSFTSGNQFQFVITSVSGGVGDSRSLEGGFSPGGPFAIGSITINGGEQTAPVTGTSTLFITDVNSVNLTGTIQWDDITTVGAGGILDLTGTINLTGLSYSGTSIDLGELAAPPGNASDVVSFQFLPPQTLTQLATTGGETSYSGTIFANQSVPEPGTLTLAGMGFAGLLAFGRRRGK
jgi:hypothetical protein